MKPFDPARGLKWLAGFAGFGVAVSGLYAATGIGFPCPLLLLTGWQCPLCGGTRLGTSLLHADIGAAFNYNPVVFVGLVVLVLLGLCWIVELLGGPKVRPPRRIALRLTTIHPTVWTAVVGVGAVAYTLGRNLL